MRHGMLAQCVLFCIDCKAKRRAIIWDTCHASSDLDHCKKREQQSYYHNGHKNSAYSQCGHCIIVVIAGFVFSFLHCESRAN